MGYTHYFTKNTDLDSDKFKELSGLASKILDASTIPVSSEYDKPDLPPICTNDLIKFNGIGNDGHETFYLDKTPGFEFCKTAYKPYDIVVTAILTVAADLFSNDISISSDGGHNDWGAGIALAQRATGRTFHNPIR